MGEKPNEQDEAAERESPTRASAGRAVAAGQSDPTPAQVGAAGQERRAQQLQDKAEGGGSPGEPAEASNLNSSKSNVAREAPDGGGAGGPEPAEATNLNSSRSNIYRQAPGGGGDPAGAQDHVYQHDQTDLERQAPDKSGKSDKE